MRYAKENESLVGFIILSVLLIGGIVAQHTYHVVHSTELSELNIDNVPGFIKTYDELMEAKAK